MSRASILVAALALAACDIDPVCLDCPSAQPPDGAQLDGGSERFDAGEMEDAPAADVGFDAPPIVCRPGAPELCNGADDDCDAEIDEGFDLASDVMNCGECSNRCAPPHAFAACIAAECAVASCDVGYYDIDGAPENGCEYRCNATGEDGLVCNLRDDDCDGMVDEGFDTLNDIDNCGACGRTCRAAHASSVCVAGECALGTCDPGYIDRDLRADTGCEVACTPAVPPDEVCNGRDDDCDGAVDEDNPGGGAACGSAVGACRAGVETCLAGVFECVGPVRPTPEVCNAADDDCDGATDEGFLGRIDNCAACGDVCSFTNAVPDCVAGVCHIAFCLPGFANADGFESNGCELTCTPTGPEVCNGLDDDCDGVPDEGLTPPSSFCSGSGVCAGTIPTCGGIAGWQCAYPAAYEATETRCDGIDSNCDGSLDESFALVGTSCGNGTGACRRAGVIACTSDGLSVVCNAPPAGTPGTETCNGLDDDCDGAVDETRASPGTSPSYVVEDMVRVSASLYVYSYEASRPDASATEAGRSSVRSCSRAGVLPWTNVTYPEALAACSAAGLRLCTEAEWQQACASSTGTCLWSYGTACSTYSATSCNGNDYDPIAGAPDNDLLLATGAMPMCYASFGGTSRIFDMSGNVKEWTQARSAGVNPLRGGSYNNTQNGIRCDFDFTLASDTFQLGNVGFRCCSSAAP